MTPSYCIADPASPMRSTLTAAFSQPAGRRAARVHFTPGVEVDGGAFHGFLARPATRLMVVVMMMMAPKHVGRQNVPQGPC
jgi:hypothetical protein